MNFEKQEISKFDGFNSNVAPELLKDEIGTARDIMNLRCERIGKLVTRNGYRICQYGNLVKPDDIDAPSMDTMYRRNGGIIGLGEFSQSHAIAKAVDRYLVSYIRSLSTMDTPYQLLNEKDDNWKFPQVKNTASSSNYREHLAGFLFSPIPDTASGTLLLSRNDIMDGELFTYKCDMNPQDGYMDKAHSDMKNLYAGIRDLSVDNPSYTNTNVCHRVLDTTSYKIEEDGVDRRYASMNQYRNKLIVSDKLNGDMAIENIWDSQTEKDETNRSNAIRIRANCVEDFDINKVYLDARFRPNQENSIADGVETGMALYKFELEKATMVMSNPLDTGEAVNPENYKVYQENPQDSKNYPTSDELKKNFFGMSENVMLANITIGSRESASRILNKHRTFTNADSNSEYRDLLGKLKLAEFEYYDDLEDKTVKRNIADTYVWEDMQLKYYPSMGVDGLSYYINPDNRIADQANANATRLTNLEVQDGIGRKAPLGGWRYKFVWDYGNGDYSAPSTEILCPDIMWSASKDDDVDKLLRQGFKDTMDTRTGYQAVSGGEWDRYKGNGFDNLSIGYTLCNSIANEFVLTTIGKIMYDIKAILYKDMKCKYGVHGTSGYDNNGKLLYSIPALPWESYNVGDFSANIMLKAPEHSIDTRGIIAEFAAFDGKEGTGAYNNIEDGYLIPVGFSHENIHAVYAMFKLAVPTFPYQGATFGYGTFERFALMNGIFDYHGRYRAKYRNSRAAYKAFFLMPSWSDTKQLNSNISTDTSSAYFNQGLFYYGIFYNHGANHTNRFYLCIEGGLPDSYDAKYGFSDIHNLNNIDINGNNINLYNKKPETLLRAYYNDNDSPVLFNTEVPAEVSSRILLSGTAKLDITSTDDNVPFYPHVYGGRPADINHVEAYNQKFVYGWDSSMPENTYNSMAITFYSENTDILNGNYVANYQGVANFTTAIQYGLLILNSDNTSVNGLYAVSYKFRGKENSWADFLSCELVSSAANTANTIFTAGYYSQSGYGAIRELKEYGSVPGVYPMYIQGTGAMAGFSYNPSISPKSFELTEVTRQLTCPLADYSVSDSNRTEVSVYLPGHRSTLLEQVVSIFPSSLLHKCPRIAIKIPNSNIPKKAKRLLIYRTLNSLSNEYDPLTYGLVKAIDIRRYSEKEYENGNICEIDDTALAIEEPTAGDVVTSEYYYTYPSMPNPIDNGNPVGIGGTEKDFYSGIYFFDDVRDTIIDFSNNPDQYEALRYALKSAYNIAIAERMFYGNVIQQYQPEAPLAYGNNGVPNAISAINSIGFITAKSDGSGVGIASKYVQYAYLFEDEMQIKSQVELTEIIKLNENAVELLGWDGTGTPPVIADDEARDIAIYFMPGSYTHGIKRTVIYRKIMDTLPTDLPYSENYMNGFYQVGEITNKTDNEGIFVDDGLINGVLLNTKMIDKLLPGDPNGNKMYVFDTPPNTYEYESGVFWSEPYRPDVIKMENFIEFGSGDGSQITGLQSQYGNIVVFKDSSIYRSAVQSENPPISRVDLVSRYEGCIAPNTLLNVEDTMFFLSSSGFMQYDNNVIKPADDAFNDELTFLLKSNESFNKEASAGYNQHFKEIYLNIPKLKATVKWIDIVKDMLPDYTGSDSIFGQTECIVDTQDAPYYDTTEIQDTDPVVNEKIFERETYGHIFVVNPHKGYNTKFGYPATSFRKLADNSSYFPIFAYHSLHLMRKYYTSERGVLYSGDVIPHWYGVNDGGIPGGGITILGKCDPVMCRNKIFLWFTNATHPYPNNRQETIDGYKTKEEVEKVCAWCCDILEIPVPTTVIENEEGVEGKPPVFWAGIYAESPCTGDSLLQNIDTNNAFGNTVYIQNSYSEMDMILNHRHLIDLFVSNINNPISYPPQAVFPKVDSIEINNVYKSKFYTAQTETVLKRLRSAGINMFAKGNIRVLYSQFPVESVDSGIRYTPLPEIFLSTNNNFMEHTVIQSRYNYPPTTDVYNKWLNTVIVGTQENVLYFVPDTRMANNRYKGQMVPMNDDIGKPLKFSIEIYSQGRTQINALTYHIRHIWSYLR